MLEVATPAVPLATPPASTRVALGVAAVSVGGVLGGVGVVPVKLAGMCPA